MARLLLTRDRCYFEEPFRRHVGMLRFVWLCLMAACLGYAAEPHPFMDEYNRAWQLVGQLRPDEAIPLLKQIIAKDKTFHRAYDTVVDAYRQKNDLDGAERYFRSLLDQDPGNGLPHYGLGELYRSKGQWGAAAEHYTSCIQESPQAHNCYVRLGEALASLNKGVTTPGDLGARLPGGGDSLGGKLALAKMYQIQYRPEATQVAEAGLSVARSQNDAELVALFDDLLAQAYGRLDDHKKAVSCFQEKLEIAQELNDWEMQLDTAYQLGGAYLLMGDFERARSALDGALAQARNLGHRWAEASLLYELGRYHNRRGDQGEALRCYWEVKKIYDQLNEGFGFTNLLLDIGSVYETLGDLEQARRTFEECRASARKIGLKWHEAFALRRLGDVYRDSGEYFKALESLSEAVRMFREMGRMENAGAGLRVIASVHSALGNYGYATDYYQQSLSAARDIFDIEQQERTLQGLGRLYLRMEKPKQALPYLQQALAISDRNRRTNLRSGTLLSIGDAYRLLGRYPLALDNLSEGLRIARQMQNEPDEAAALTGLGRCYLKIADLAQAEARFSEGRELAERAGLPEVILAARAGLAETCLRRGEHTQALRHLQAAVETIESLRVRIPTPELRAGFAQQNWRIYEDAIYVLSLLHGRDPAKGYDRQAFAYAERGRARAFLDMLAESKASITKGLAPEQLQRQTRLLSELSKASAALLRENSEPNKHAVERAERNLAEWALEIRRTNPRYHELEYPEPYDAAQAQAALSGSGTVILEYALGDRRSFLWIVTEKRARMAVLPGRKEIENQVASFRELIARRPKGDPSFDTWQAPARRLHKLLLGPAGGSLGAGRRLIIIPDGALYYLPFESLITTAEGDPPRCLIEDHPIAYAPSATVFGSLLAENRKEERPRGRDLLAYGDPAFGTGRAAPGISRMGDVVRGVYQASGIEFSPLPNTRAEVESIAALYPADRRKIYLGRSATEASVKHENLRDYKRLHFATHAVLDEQVPARSGVVLSLVDTGEEDGILRANEIFNLELNADLVVLSACRTGLGKLVKGEGMVGLTRAFLYAGSPRVVVSLWEVNDFATAGFMKIYYRKMKDGKGPGLALREAKLEMLHSDSLAYRHPYFWTPFILVGAF